MSRLVAALVLLAGLSPNGAGSDGFSNGIGTEGISPPGLRPSFYAPLTSTLTPTIGPSATFTRADASTCATVLGYASTATNGAAQVILTVPAGEARFQGARRVSAGVWSDSYADGTLIPAATRLGYLSEGSRTNLILQSQTFDNASWTKTRSSISGTTTGPDGGATSAQGLIEDASATTTHAPSQAVTVAASALPYTLTVYAKANARTRIALQLSDGTDATRVGFDLSGGQVAYGPAIAAGVGWTSPTATISTTAVQGFYRCTLTATSKARTGLTSIILLDNGSGTAADATVYSGDGTSGVYLWGADLEQAAFPSTYIGPTLAAAVTRAADLLTYASAGVLNTLLPFTTYAEAQTGASASTQEFIVFSTSNNYAAYFALNTLSGGVMRQFNSAAGSGGSTAATVTDLNDYAGVFDGTTNTVYVNAIAGTPVANGTALDGGATIYVGESHLGTAPIFGTIRNARFYRRALTAAQVATIPAAP